jgi:hypothetical protein
MQKFVTAIRILCFASIVFFALYLGIAGWVGSRVLASASEKIKIDTNSQILEYDGITFKTEHDLKVVLLRESVIEWFPWVLAAPVPPSFFAAIGFGMLGGVGALLRKNFISKKEFLSLPIVVEPLFACIIGTMLFFLSFLLPAILTTNSNPRPEALVGFSLLGGFFSEQTYDWLRKNIIDKVFPKGAE